MGKRKRQPTQVADALLEELLVDAYGEDEQLWVLRESIVDAFELPMDVHVVGEPLSLVDVTYDGNPRRGLVARCRREDGSEYQVGLADVQMSAEALGYPYLAAYCKWLGVEPAGSSRTQTSRPKARRHKAGEDDLDLSKPIELVVLDVKTRAARCRLLDSDRVITLRSGDLHRIVPGQIATVMPHKHWRHAGHPYLSGKIESARIDAQALGLVPLALRPMGQWDPAEECGGEDEDVDDWEKPIIARGPRPMFEMEQVLPGRDPDDDIDADPILEANELREVGDTAGAQALLGRLLEADLRCLDAHAHLGNILFPHSPWWALRHYEVGIRIGELSLGADFDGVLPWGFLDNRPFLRCMQGYGLCLWRLERWEEAERVFERMLWLNPLDHQGMRFVLPQVRQREPWVDGEM